MAIDIVSREQWGARPARKTSRIPLPSRELWLHHTVGEYSGPSGMRRLQAFHQDERNFRDVGYSLVIDRRTLIIYEGAGIGILGAHTKHHNAVGHGIGVTGNYDNLTPTEHLLDLLAELVHHGYVQGWWPDQFTGGHRDTKATDCPGDNLYAKIRIINSRAVNLKETTMDYPTEDVKTIQARLKELGYDIGTSGVDGILGPKTMSAYNAAMDDLGMIKPNLGKLVQKGELLDRFAAATAEIEAGEGRLQATRGQIRDLYGI